MSTEVWICGQRTEEWSETGTPWDFQGVFTDESKAVNACRDETYFIFPATMNAELPHEPVVSSRARYPLLSTTPTEGNQ